MNNGRVFFGILLVFIGLFIFLASLGESYRELLGMVTRLWPVVFILLGAGLLFTHQPVGRMFIYGALLVLVLVIAGAITGNRNSTYRPFNSSREQNQITVKRADYPELTSLKLDLEFGGGSLRIGSSADEWFEGNFRGMKADCRVRSGRDDVRIQVDPAHKTNLDFRDVEWVMNIAPNLLTDLDIKTGALNGELDLSRLRCRRMELNLGAGEMEVRFGDTVPESDVKIHAGAAKIRLKIPDTLGVKLELNGVLNNNNLDRLNWIREDNRYYSPNYQTAKNKMEIDAEVSVSEFEVETVSWIGDQYLQAEKDEI